MWTYWGIISGISLCKFLKSEVTRSYFLQQHEERYEFKREQIYTFMKIPREIEKLIGYGFFQVRVLTVDYIYDINYNRNGNPQHFISVRW